MADVEIEGFVFSHPDQITQAKKEAEGVAYLRARLDRNNPNYVLQVYNHAVDQKLFETPVGFAFLKELQDYLKSLNIYPAEDIHGIEVPPPRVIRRKDPKPERTDPKDAAKLKRRFSIALFFDLVLLAAVIGMFVIAFLSRDNVTILNYENAIINKYEEWDQELTERERVIREKEHMLEGQ